MLAIVSLLMIVAISLIVTRTAAGALTYTGLSQQAASFQARSAFTGVGYTTSEAESLVNHPVRRQVVMLLMLLGNAGIVTVVATSILSFVGTGDTGVWRLRLALLIAGLGVMYLVAKIRWVDRQVHYAIEWSLRKWARVEGRDFILSLAGDYGVSEMAVQADDWLAGKSLSESAIDDEGILVLGIQRRDGSYIGTPAAETIVKAGDVVILYGRSAQLAELDVRCSGDEGNQRHDAACGLKAEVCGKALK